LNRFIIIVNNHKLYYFTFAPMGGLPLYLPQAGHTLSGGENIDIRWAR